MHLIGGSPQKEIREIENASVQILRSIFMALAMGRSFEKITKWNGYRCSPQFWAGTSRSKALAGIPSFVQTKFKQVSLICQKRNIFGEIMMLAPVTRILSCDMNDFKCNQSCLTITLIIILPSSTFFTLATLRWGILTVPVSRSSSCRKRLHTAPTRS